VKICFLSKFEAATFRRKCSSSWVQGPSITWSYYQRTNRKAFTSMSTTWGWCKGLFTR